MHRLTLLGLFVLTLSLAAPASGQQPKLKEVDSPGAAIHRPGPFRSDVIRVPLKAAADPGKGHEVEYMVRMKTGDSLVYSWETAPGSDVWHEFHGHTPQTVTFYKKAGGTSHHGSLTAPFDGIHGWYFENRTKRPVSVRLRLSGYYELIPKPRK